MTIASKLVRVDNAVSAIKQSIANKGRDMSGKVLEQFAEEIDGIVQGGGGSGDFVVRFWDRGVLLKTEYVDASEDATPPTPPTYANLTFVAWNNPYTNVQGDVDADAIYNHTIVQINLNDPNWLTPTIYLNKADTSVLNIYNGATLLATSSASGNIQLSLTLPAVGEYDLRIECTGAYNFGNGSSSTSIFIIEYKTITTGIFVGTGVTMINSSAFQNCTSLALTSLPAGLATISVSAFQSCTSLALTSLPAGLATINSSVFQNCTSLALTSLPAGLATINSSAFREVKRMITLTLSPDTTSIGDYAFYNCSNILSYTIDIETPPTLVNIRAFQGINAACKIYVPASAVDTYKAATNWITYAAYIFAIPA